MQTSSAYILVQAYGYRYSFDGVSSIAHALSLKVAKDSASSDGADYVNNARNEPDTVTLSVLASDTHVAQLSWAMQTFRSMAMIKEARVLCTVVTPLRTYPNMLLTSLSALEDENSQSGWTGTLTFTQTDPPAEAVKSANNASTPSSSGASSAPRASSSGSSSSSVLKQILKESGISAFS